MIPIESRFTLLMILFVTCNVGGVLHFRSGQPSFVFLLLGIRQQVMLLRYKIRNSTMLGHTLRLLIISCIV